MRAVLIRIIYDCVIRIVLPNGSSESIEYDVLGRVTEIQHPTHKDRIEYYQSGDNATNIPVRVRSGKDSKKYTYDKRGNIKEIFENGKLSVKYEYDGLDRLVREDNVRLNRTFTFDYDTTGIFCMKRYQL